MSDLIDSFLWFLRLMALIFSICFVGVLYFSCQNEQSSEVQIMRSRSFKGEVTSLNPGKGDTLLVGTISGHLYFYNVRNEEYRDLAVGNDIVYFACQDEEGLFVGVRNAGLRLLTPQGKEIVQYKLLSKDTNYSVYNVERLGDTLFCATSNGLCMLNLKNLYYDSLQLLFPKELPGDYKIKPMWLSHDSLYMIHGDTVRFRFKGKMGSLGTRQIMPKEDTVKKMGRIYNHKQHENRLYYPVYPTFDLIVPTDEGFFAVMDTNQVYLCSRGEFKHSRLWSRTLSRDLKGLVSDIIFLPDGKRCLVLSGGKVYVGNKRSLKQLKPQNSKLKNDDVNCMLYDKENQKLFLGFRQGYAFLPANEHGDCQDDMKFFVDTPITVQCLAFHDDSLYVGTLNDGCLVCDKQGKKSRSLHYNNVKDIHFSGMNMFFLTSDSLYVKGVINMVFPSQGVAKMQVWKQPSGYSMAGISNDGCLYVFNTDSLQSPVNYSAISSRDPKAFVVFGDSLMVSTSQGVFTAPLDNLNKLSQVTVRNPDVNYRFLWLFILILIVIVVVGVVAIVAALMLRKRDENKLTPHPYMMFYNNCPPNSIEENKHSDWVSKTAVKYDENYERMCKRESEVEFKTKTEELKKSEIEMSMLKYAFAVELYKLRNSIFGEEPSEQIIVIYESVTALRKRYLDKCLSFKARFSNQIRTSMIAHLWVLALLSVKDKEYDLINDMEFMERYLKFLADKENAEDGKKIKNIKQYVHNLKIAIREEVSSDDSILFEINENYKDFYDEMCGEIKDKIGLRKKYDLSEFKIALKEYVEKKELRFKRTWFNLIGKIKLVEKAQYEKADFTKKDLEDGLLFTRGFFTENKESLEKRLESLIDLEKLKEVLDSLKKEFEVNNFEKIQENDSLERIRSFYDGYFLNLFSIGKRNEINTKRALHIWLLFILLDKDGVFEGSLTDEWLWKYVFKIENPESVNENEKICTYDNKNVENWKTILTEYANASVNESNILRLKNDIYKELIDEWKEVAIKFLNPTVQGMH